MSEANRPLSPHLSVYKWEVSNTLSILHRMSGVALSIGALALLAWIVAAAAGAESYEVVRALLAGPLGLFILFGFSASFFYHMGNGIRHLAWDAGYGFDKGVARASGWFTFIVALLLTGIYWLVMA